MDLKRFFNDKPALPDNENPRDKIARKIVYFGMAALFGLGLASIGLAIAFSSAKDAEFAERANFVKDVLTAELPMLGTWIGTILAYYFSKENFLAAAAHTEAMVQLTQDKKLQAIVVTEAMLDMASADTTKIVSDTPDVLKLKVDLMDKRQGRERLPIVSTSGVVKYLLHLSKIEGFIAGKVLAGNTAPLNLTLQNLLDEIEFKPFAIAFRTVSKTDRLDKVKILMENTPNCSDVFVHCH